MIIEPLLAMMLGAQVPKAAPPAPQERQRPPRPGMLYDAITDRYVPIVGWRPANSANLPTPTGTKFQPNRLGQKLGEAPIGH